MADDVGAPRQSDRTATRGSVEVMSRGEVMGCARWASAFAGKHRDHRYYELVEDTIQPDFVFRYFAIKDEDGSVRAVQPFFIIDQDLLLGTNTRLGAHAEHQNPVEAAPGIFGVFPTGHQPGGFTIGECCSSQDDREHQRPSVQSVPPSPLWRMFSDRWPLHASRLCIPAQQLS